jgi:hypothetical protein
MAEPWRHGAQDGRSVDSVSWRPQGEPCPLKCWYSFAKALGADAEGCNAHRRQHQSIRVGEDGKVRRSPQAVACRKRGAQELGKPQRLLGGKTPQQYGLQLLRHGRGTPDTEQCWNLGDAVDHGARQAEQYWQRERPPYALGESYRA